MTTRRRPWRFRLVALALALMLPSVPLLPHIDSIARAFAEVDPCSPSANRILQDICVDGVPNPDLIQFEQDTVNAWLMAHGMAPSNASLIYEHGRGDLRSQIRGAMFARILAIIFKADPTANEQAVLDWFRQRVQAKEVGVFQHAVDERDRWANDPCHWRPDPEIADVFGLYYNGGGFCAGGLLTLFTTQPQVPDKSYFLAAGFMESYVAGIAGSPFGPETFAETFDEVGPAILISVVGASAAALGISILTSVFVESLVGSLLILTTAATIFLVLSATIVAFLAVLIGIIAAFELYEGQKTLDELAELDTLLADAEARPVSLIALAGNDEGKAKLKMTLVEATLPEFPSSSTLPAHESDDALFYVGHLGAPPSMVVANLSYQDWEGDVWTATPYRGFFIQHGTENGSPVTSFSPVLRIRDPHTGERLRAELVGSNFLVARADPEPDQELCMANPFTGLSDADLSTCKAYVVPGIDLRDENGDQETVTLAELPSFTSLPSATFTEGVAKSFDVTAIGPPLPSISIVGSLPAGFSFAAVGDSGVLHLSYDGTTPIGVSEHSLVMQAVNDRGAASQDFTIRTGTAVAFTSSDRPPFVGGKFSSFLITTSGNPVPTIDFPITVIPSLGPVKINCLGPGLSLHDNGDGTATLSGTIPFADPPGFATHCNIEADNGFSSVIQTLIIHSAEPPLAQVASASSTTFFPGVPNSFDVVTHGAETPVTISLPCHNGTAVAPSWVSVVDHGDGTATLSGTPPVGTDGAFSFRVQAFTSGQIIHIINCDAPTFTINVSNVPAFLSSNRIQFGAPPLAGPPFMVTTNQSSGVIALAGELPEGLVFNAHGDGSATIDGAPAVGTGGVYPLVLSLTNAAGTGFQNARLQVKEAPTFDGALNSAVFYVGVDNSFPVPTTGFPKSPTLIGNANPVELAMHIALSGALPGGVSFRDTNSLDMPTGTGVFAGIPDAGSEGVYPLTLTADNGVPPAANLDFTLFVVKAGDVNRDGVVDKGDLDLISGSLNKTLADPDYDPLIDTNHDGIIDEQDLQFVADACPDPDGDGACESATEDRDGDGIPDAEDFDPTGYLYDRSSGAILSGGRVTVSPPPASMPSDGSGGFYQFFVAPGETVYTLTVQLPPGCRPAACARLDPPPLDPAGASVALGSSEVGASGHLASAACSDNPHALTMQLGEMGDEVLLNNLPFDCGARALAPAPALDARGIALALLVLLGVAALGFRRRRAPERSRHRR